MIAALDAQERKKTQENPRKALGSKEGKEGPGALLPKLPDHRLKPLPLYALYAGSIVSQRNFGPKLRPPGISIPTFQKPPHGCDVQALVQSELREREKKSKAEKKYKDCRSSPSPTSTLRLCLTFRKDKTRPPHLA